MNHIRWGLNTPAHVPHLNLYSVYTNNKLSHPSSLSSWMRSCPTMVKSAVLPKTTSLCGSMIVITLCQTPSVQYIYVKPKNLPSTINTNFLGLRSRRIKKAKMVVYLIFPTNHLLYFCMTHLIAETSYCHS